MIGTGAMLATGGVIYPYFIEPWRVAVNHIPIRIPELPAAWNGLTIAHLTDLHRSRYVSGQYLQDCVARANALNPDLIVFTGDYLTEGRTRRGLLVYGDHHDAATYVKDSARCIGQARARHGVFASLGNHDHWFDADTVTREIEAAGVPVLRNRPAFVKINGETLPIVGLGDLWTEGVNFSQGFAGVNHPYAIVLMHNPDSFEHWPQPGHHLILAGHTHGGQVNIPFYGPPVVPSRYGMKYAQGLHQRGTAQMYVNRGLGLVFPVVRFNCRPEIAVLHLQRA
jgi:predicted MPP superfamily phosphohydrolase